MQINKNELLKELESVTAGTSQREIVEQSSCFVFTKGKVYTYNDEIACQQETSLKIDGAIQASPFLALLRKIQDEQIKIGKKDNMVIL